MKTEPILLDQWHVSVYINPKQKLKKSEKELLCRMMETLLRMSAARITDELQGQVEVRITQ